MSFLVVAPRPESSQLLLARVWDDLVETETVGKDADCWLSEFLGVRCKLVHLLDESIRPVNPAYGESGDRVGLAECFPFLLVSEGSLTDLNTWLERPLPMNCFRPNLVVRGCDPLTEDGWRLVRIGPITLRVVKPCARCAITTVNQRTGVRGDELLRRLARLRRVGTKVLFGQNLVYDEMGALRGRSRGEALRSR